MQKTGPKYSEDTATLFLSIPNFVSIFAAPLFGLVIDKFGRSVFWVILASAMLVVAHFMFLGKPHLFLSPSPHMHTKLPQPLHYYTPGLANANDWFFVHPIPILLWLGFGYSMLASSLWPLLPYIIQPNMLGTAYGAMTAVQNAGLAVFPQIIGSLQVLCHLFLF